MMLNRRPLAGVQIARGLAATIVVLAHANLLIDSNMFHGWFVEGWCGVDFFFVLSGFIIFYANGKDIGHPERLSLYAYKRFVRIFPIYWIYTLGILLVGFALLPVLHKQLIVWIKISPLTILKCLSLYPTDAAHNVMPFIPVAWTLSYELLFYIVFGGLIFFPKRIAGVIFSIWMLSSVTSLILNYGPADPLLTVLTSPKNVEFFFGAAIAYLVVRKPQRWRGFYWPALTAAVVALTLAWSNAHMHYRYLASYNPLSFGIPFAAIVFCVVGLELSNSRDLRAWQRPFLYAGDASYSIYLVHFPLVVLFKVLLPRLGLANSYLRFAIIAPVCILLGMACYSLIESPLLQALNRRYLPARTRPA
jgi:exopolysaccharide production protein ExoZ